MAAENEQVEPEVAGDLSPEHQAIKDKIEADKVAMRDRLKAAAAAAKESAKPRPPAKRPRDFDPKKPPDTGYQIKIPVEAWQIIHGSNPNSIWLQRGLDSIPDHEVLQTDAPCHYCGAFVQKFFHGRKSCLGCGIPPVAAAE